MKELNIPPFYVGQRVVQLINGTQSKTKIGDVHTVLGLNQLKCGCWCIDIGQKARYPESYCNSCQVGGNINNGVLWLGSKYFAPVQESFQSISLEKILEKETSLISAS